MNLTSRLLLALSCLALLGTSAHAANRDSSKLSISKVLLAQAEVTGQTPPRTSPTRGLRKVEITVAGVKRTYYVAKPQKGADEPRAVIIVLHGIGGATQMRSFGFEALASKENFVVVYPLAIGGLWNDGRGTDWLKARHKNADDIAFVRAIIDRMVQNKVADPRRIYVVGQSNGGLMALRVACEMSDIVAAVSAVNAGLPSPLAATCAPAKGMPLLLVNGTADPVIPFTGGRVGATLGEGDRGNVVSNAETLSIFRRVDACPAQSTVTDFPDRDTDDGTRVRSEIWTGCRDSAELASYVIDGGGHRWPGMRATTGPDPQEKTFGRSSRDLMGRDVVWTFLKRFLR